MMRPNRRQFLKLSASTLAIPALRLRGWTSEILRVACFGVGGMGKSDLRSVASADHVRIVALCDTDSANLASAAKDHPEAKTFKDFRRVFDTMEKEIDAVVVSTPDHMHAPIALRAMHHKKHVYCQKPIAHSLQECQQMTQLAEEQGVVTQMGTQIHSNAAYKTAVETVRQGLIGKVKEAHLWVSKSWAGPKEGRPEGSDPIPENLDWDLWLGVAPERKYSKGHYHPARWRGWVDFGCGTLGDMGCHIFDPVFSALGIGAPSRVISQGPQHTSETFAPDSDIVYEFPETEFTQGTLRFRWTDGSRNSRPDAAKAQLPDDVKLPGAGSFLVGEKGVLVTPHWATPKIYSEGELVPVELPKLQGVNHYHEWADACRGIGQTSTPFRYSGPLTEAVLVGTVAGHFPGQSLSWDAAKGAFDHELANAHVKRAYRKGWEWPS